jgi:LVIVD repeat
MESRTNIKALFHLKRAWLVAYSTFLSTCLAQRIDTLLIPPNQPSAHDAPAYISSVAHRVAVAGDFVYLADGYAGLGVYKLKLGGPESARLIGEYLTGEYTHTVRVDGDWAYALDSLNGIVVFDVRDPMKLRRLADASPEAMARAFRDDVGSDSGGVKGVAAMVENRVYIARQDLGVAVIEMRSPRDMPPPPFRHSIIQNAAVPMDHSLNANVQVPLSEVHPPPVSAQMLIGAASGDDYTAIPAETNFRASAAPPELTAHFEAGILILRLSGSPGQTLHVQRSSSVTGEWKDWQTITLGEVPTELTDEEAASADQIFYRAVTP